MSHEPASRRKPGRARRGYEPSQEPPFSCSAVRISKRGGSQDGKRLQADARTGQPLLSNSPTRQIQPRLRIVKSLPCSPLPSIPLCHPPSSSPSFLEPHASPPPPSYSLPSPCILVFPSASSYLARFPTSGLPTDHCPPCAPYGRTRISCSARPKCKLIDASFQEMLEKLGHIIHKRSREGCEGLGRE